MDRISGYDVIVVGGGTSGVAAAIAAARVGAKTLVVERNGALGGQMNVSGPPGFAYANLYNDRQEQIIGGIITETHERLLKEGHALPHIEPDFRGWYTFAYVDPDWWGLLAFEMMRENGVSLLLHSLAVDAVKEGDTVKGVTVENVSGRQTVFGKILIDCTGEGEFAARAGAPYEILPKDRMEPHSLSFTADGVDWEKVLDYIRRNPEEFEFERFQENTQHSWTYDELAARIRKVDSIEEFGEVMGYRSIKMRGLETGEWHGSSGIGFFLIPREGGVIQAHFQHSSQIGDCDATNVGDLTFAEIECRRQIVVAWKFIKKYLPGFEKAYITRICPEVRIREGRRIMGDYVLTGEDVVEERKFEDVVYKSAFPAGAVHVVGPGTLGTMKPPDVPKNGGSHDVPYRCLVPRYIENLLVAGKAISARREAYQRFLMQNMVSGQAAGVAAALCARDNITPRMLESDVNELQRILVGQGAILTGTH
ncbi:MAG: FAD-dependent oxidoreductase [Acidobacteria bacterium]|nr:FAD-dependent oxidoreductase [Acidobacteriota bacterium]